MDGIKENMKQHITIDQLNELSDKGKEKLREWWRPRELPFVIVPPDDDSIGSGVNCYDPNWECYWGVGHDWTVDKQEVENKLPLLSIGQMIEFLNEHIDSSISSLAIDRGEFHWHVYVVDSIRGAFPLNNDQPITAPELCDALWKAVKEVLEREA